jgi:hypothetical protein
MFSACFVESLNQDIGRRIEKKNFAALQFIAKAAQKIRQPFEVSRGSSYVNGYSNALAILHAVLALNEFRKKGGWQIVDTAKPRVFKGVKRRTLS